ncbi:MAG: hypothetical protein ACYSTL_03220 [Planctomycetota bacterium]|jgi:hypothetical protein
MKRLAIIISVMGFFAMAFVGWFCGLSTYGCAIKALMGAVILYVVVHLAGRWIVEIMVGAVIDNMQRQQQIRSEASERGGQ